jgi:hypothetical protein
MFKLKSELRFFELSQTTFLDVVFGEKESRTDTSGTSANCSKYERPTKPIVCISRHPFVSIAKQRKDYHSEACTNASSEKKISGDLK